MTNKVKAGATSFGSFFSGVVNKAGAGVAKIKETVKDNVSESRAHSANKLMFVQTNHALNKSTMFPSSSFNPQSLLSDFNKEQEQFIKDQSGKSGDAGVCPWVGHKNEDKIKEEVLNLSAVS